MKDKCHTGWTDLGSAYRSLREALGRAAIHAIEMDEQGSQDAFTLWDEPWPPLPRVGIGKHIHHRSSLRVFDIESGKDTGVLAGHWGVPLCKCNVTRAVRNLCGKCLQEPS